MAIALLAVVGWLLIRKWKKRRLLYASAGGLHNGTPDYQHAPKSPMEHTFIAGYAQSQPYPQLYSPPPQELGQGRPRQELD